MTADLDVDNLDTILTEVGEFGLYQVIIYFLICIPSALSASYQVSYMFSANPLEYRCKVPECDVGDYNRDIVFDQPWLRSAIPYENGKLDSCSRYAPIHRNGTINLFDQCSSENFNTSLLVPCTEFIYASDEKNIQTEFSIHCENSYDLAFVGMVSNIGRVLFLPITGLMSDRFGRLNVIVCGLTFGCCIGLIKSFSTTYLMYLIFEFLESLGTTTFAGTFALAIETVCSKYRVLGSMIVAMAFPVGEILLSIVAMYVHDFRHWIRLIYAPGLLLFVYLWIMPESIRWLLSTGRVDRAIAILKRSARVNGKKLSEKSIQLLKMKYSNDSKTTNNNSVACEKALNDSANTSLTQSLSAVLKSKTLCLRLLNCCYLYFACSFCYYGLSMSALSIPGTNQYTAFILVAAIEVPGILVAIFLLNRIKRRQLMVAMLFITAISTIVTPWIPKRFSWLVLMSFMIGKASISCTFNSIYVYAAEQWPTNIRSTVLNLCGTFGKMGPMIAPVIAVLATQYESLPAILFGSVAIVGSALALLCPETYKKKLPDTVQEAKELK